MARKTSGKKRTKEQKQKLEVTPKDYVFPGEKSSYLSGVVGTGVVFAFLAALGFFTIKNAAGQHLFYIPLEVMAWPVLAVIIANSLAIKPRAAQLKKAGRQAKVMSNNHPELFRILSRQSSLLGFKKMPDMYVVNDPLPVLYSVPGAVILSQTMRERVTEGELEVLIAHELTHIRCKHVRLELAQVFIRSANPVLKIVFFPVLLVMVFSKAWIELIDFTADRGALLVTLKPGLVNTAIVKQAVVTDPNAGITPEELAEFLNSAADLQTDTQQLERHFKVGQFMSSQPNLRERIEQLTDFPQSDEGKAAIAKMAEIQGVPLASITLVRAASEDGIEHIQEGAEG